MPDSLVIDKEALVEYVTSEWGNAPGETFVAVDTVITAITVWRKAAETPNDAPMKLWIVAVDSTGRPRNDQVVFEGPVLQVPYGDGIHPIEVRFVLDPPAVLPHEGTYAFLVQNLCFQTYDFLVADGTTYSQGKLWRSEISNYDGCILNGIYDYFDEYDLCCKIELCGDMFTPTQHASWGTLKIKYVDPLLA